MNRLKRLTIALGAGLFVLSGGTAMAASSWQAILDKAKGQTVYFNAWGGGEAINAYIDWAAGQVKDRYGVTVEHVRITDAADVVKRIDTEHQAGRVKDGGSVDLIWVNGENFKALKDKGLLYGPFAGSLPNFANVDLAKPVQVDFSVPVDGLESPWGTAQLTFIADRSRLAEPPHSAAELLALAKREPGRITYPRPPDFHGTTFLKQLLIETTDQKDALKNPVSEADFDSVTKNLWAYLDALHPLLWRQGKAFPANIADMHKMLADRELILSLTFNPNEGANLVANGQLPDSAYSFGFDKGTIGNVHFVAIPANANAKEGAEVFADFLLSPEAQARKADIKIWGDGTVLDVARLPAELKTAFASTAPGGLDHPVPTLAEPHASWVSALEAAWLKRYGGQ